MPQLEQRLVGHLNCHIVTAQQPELLVVLAHGFGAPGDDLVPLAPHLLSLVKELNEKVVFVFPAAPLSLADYGYAMGRAWWPLDMERLNRAVESGEFRDLRNQSPPELPRVSQMLAETIALLQAECGLSYAQTVVGGFSQGSMLATDFAFNAEHKPAGLVIWSGTLINEQQWRKLAGSISAVPVIQSHGTLDPILPYAAAMWLLDMLLEAGAEVEFIEFEGPHTIPPNALSATANLLALLLARNDQQS